MSTIGMVEIWGYPLQVPLCQECRRMIRPIVFGYKKIVVVWRISAGKPDPR